MLLCFSNPDSYLWDSIITIQIFVSIVCDLILSLDFFLCHVPDLMVTFLFQTMSSNGKYSFHGAVLTVCLFTLAFLGISSVYNITKHRTPTHKTLWRRNSRILLSCSHMHKSGETFSQQLQNLYLVISNKQSNDLLSVKWEISVYSLISIPQCCHLRRRKRTGRTHTHAHDASRRGFCECKQKRDSLYMMNGKHSCQLGRH